MKLIIDNRTNEKEVHTNLMKCSYCLETLKEEETVYYADYEKKVMCRKCMRKGEGSIYNTNYYWAIIKEVKQ